MLLPGCGGGGSDSGGSTRAGAAERARYVRTADPICKRTIEAIQRLNLAPSTGPHANILTPTTEGLVRPGIPILAREAARLRALQPRPNDVDLRTYLGIFDPILVLAEQRLRAGEKPDTAEATRLENLIVGLENDQARAAHRFGFQYCGTGFFAAFGARPPG